MFGLKYDWRPIIILFIAVGCFCQLRAQQLAKGLDRQNYTAQSNIRLNPALKWKFKKGKAVFFARRLAGHYFCRVLRQ
jgi:hypothetical protein